jgi:hypothetical protein
MKGADFECWRRPCRSSALDGPGAKTGLICGSDPNGDRRNGTASSAGNIMRDDFAFRGNRGGGGFTVRFQEREGLRVSFRGLPDLEGARTLVDVVPKEDVEKEYPFTFKDVPLP